MENTQSSNNSSFNALQSGANTLGVELDRVACERLVIYLRMLQKWGGTHNLSRVLESESVINYHFIDSFALLSHLDVAEPLLDVGTGAGMPGMVLAVTESKLPVVLVEKNYKKCAFLRAVKARLGLQNVEIIESKVEAIKDATYQQACARAFGSLEYTRSLCLPRLKAGGKLWVMVGKIPSAAPLDAQVIRLSLKHARHRHLVVIQK